MTASLLRPTTSSTLLARLIDAPDLVRTVRALPPPAFSALVRRVGVEDSGEVVALATTEQLVAAFDEDLFVNARPGERETFDRARFVVWLEVLLEAGDAVAAARVAELSEDFVARALSSIVLVLDHDGLRARMAEGGDDAAAADKAIESSLSEEVDRYLLVSRAREEGWDAALALVLALDRDHRAFLDRVLDRCANVASGYLDDMEGLATALCAEDSLAEDVEAEREERRTRQGHVEPRAARSFLALAREPLAGAAAWADRDPITAAFFRDSSPPSDIARSAAAAPKTARLRRAVGEVAPAYVAPLPASAEPAGQPDRDVPLAEALRLLRDLEPRAFDERTDELAYLANVLLAGAARGERRFEPAEAAEAALATVGLGAELKALERSGAVGRPAPAELCEVLRHCRADVLFRKASSTLVAREIVAGAVGFLRSCEELRATIDELRPGRGRWP